ncbi:NAD-dependent epimerase/dehydratase family protein [Marinilabiliaceae bacterium JC017]|nr:NAD-dependent epimerase/dehydratase family protein [Marinilabiliaceae bacterium JC017]
MKTAVIAGATGLIGQCLMKHLIKSYSFSRIIILSRHHLKITDPKVDVITLDFETLPDLNIHEHIDDVFCTLGSTQKKAGSKEAFRQVDFDYVVNLSRWAVRHNARSFSVVSSVGANPTSSSFYLRTKGQMETAVKQCDIPSIFIYRPSLLLGNREKTRSGEQISAKILNFIAPLLTGKFIKYRAIEATKVARVMYKMTFTQSEDIFTFESNEIEQISAEINPLE